jgi:diacylglycerol kinase family enzyme
LTQRFRKRRIPSVRQSELHTLAATESVHRTIYILNGASGHAREARALVTSVSQEFGVAVEVVVARGDELGAAAAQAVRQGSERIVAGGGDGTVNAVAGVVTGTNAALGVLPIGTLNHFAKDLGIPLDLAAAVRTTITGRVVKVDVGEVNGHIFINNSGTGPYPYIVRQREEQQRLGHAKWVAFGLAIWAAARRYYRLRVKLQLDEADAHARLTPFLFVGNNRYEITGLEIGRRASLQSGRLWVCMPPAPTRRGLVWTALRGLTGRATDRDLHAFETVEFWVQANTPRMNVSRDGEVSVMEAPLHYKIRPGALGVLVPAASVG